MIDLHMPERTLRIRHARPRCIRIRKALCHRDRTGGHTNARSKGPIQHMQGLIEPFKEDTIPDGRVYNPLHLILARSDLFEYVERARPRMSEADTLLSEASEGNPSGWSSSS